MKRLVLLALVLTQGCHLTFNRFDYESDTDAGADAGLDAGSIGPDAGDAGIRTDATTMEDAATDGGCVTMVCAGECTDTTSDPRHCGSCDMRCTVAPENATSVCEDGGCGFFCNPGYARVLGSCLEREAPRQISPLSTARTTSNRPTLRWELAARTDGARVELCEDRACTSVLQTVDATGASIRVPADLSPGVVFWRLFSLAGSTAGPSPSATWQFYVSARSAAGDVDTSWGSTLDINGDGFADIAVGAPSFGTPALGAAHVFLGGASGVTAVPETVQGPSGMNEEFGRSVASAGDVNGDGYADLIVGAPGANALDGAAYVFLGGTGLLMARRQTLRPPPGAVDESFGLVVAGAGDLNGDGFADVAIGAPGGGRVYVHHGSPSGLSTSPQVILADPGGPGEFGWAVASGGDVDGDGFADLAIGAPRLTSDTGAAHIFRGGPSGLDPTSPGLRHSIVGSSTNERFGWSITSSDPDGNGFADFIVGAPGASSGTGAARLYSGGPGGLDPADLGRRQVIVVGSPNEFFGTTVSAAGDINGDGFADIAFGSPAASSGAGAVHLYSGGPVGIDPTGSERYQMLAAPLGGSFGIAATAGDIDGDGFADLIVGAPGVSSNSGAVHIFRGDSDGVDFARRQTLAAPSGGARFFGRSVASGS